MVSARRQVVLVASAGGHLAQLGQVADLFAHDDRRWVTFADAGFDFGSDPVMVCHSPTTRHIPNLARNLVLALREFRARPPDLVVSTGAGPAVPFMAAARLVGASTVFIEVFDRVDSRTLTGRLVAPLADRFLVQWPAQRRLYGEAAVVIGPLYPLASVAADPTALGPDPKNDSVQPPPDVLDVLVTVGTDHHRFDRLVGWIDDLARANPGWKIFVQRGTSPPTDGVESVDRLSRQELAERLDRADVVVAHGGPSTILEARAHGHRPVVVPRRSDLDEHVDDHQLAFAQALAQAGAAEVVESQADHGDLEAAILRVARTGRGPATDLAMPASTAAELVGQLAGLRRRPVCRGPLAGLWAAAKRLVR